MHAFLKEKIKMRKMMTTIPEDFPVQPLEPGEPAEDPVTCGTCGNTWDDAISTQYTPTPSARCPFEAFHKQELCTNLIEKINELYCLYDEVKSEVRRLDSHLYERWAAGGFLIDTDIISMYPNLSEVANELEVNENEEDY